MSQVVSKHLASQDIPHCVVPSGEPGLSPTHAAVWIPFKHWDGSNGAVICDPGCLFTSAAVIHDQTDRVIQEDERAFVFSFYDNISPFAFKKYQSSHPSLELPLPRRSEALIGRLQQPNKEDSPWFFYDRPLCEEDQKSIVHRILSRSSAVFNDSQGGFLVTVDIKGRVISKTTNTGKSMLSLDDIDGVSSLEKEMADKYGTPHDLLTRLRERDVKKMSNQISKSAKKQGFKYHIDK
jgi:hypothetical protein